MHGINKVYEYTENYWLIILFIFILFVCLMNKFKCSPFYKLLYIQQQMCHAPEKKIVQVIFKIWVRFNFWHSFYQNQISRNVYHFSFAFSKARLRNNKKCLNNLYLMLKLHIYIYIYIYIYEQSQIEKNRQKNRTEFYQKHAKQRFQMVSIEKTITDCIRISIRFI